MKKLFILLFSFIGLSVFVATTQATQSLSSITEKALLARCEHAVPVSNPSFCNSFKSVAYCHCHDEHGMPPAACSDMNRIYEIMIATYHSLQGACSAQHDSSQQECIDDWNFYRSHC